MSREQPKIYSTSRFIGLLKAKELSSVAARGGVEVVGSSGKLRGGVLPMLPMKAAGEMSRQPLLAPRLPSGREIAAHGGLVPGNLAFFSRGGSSQVAPFYDERDGRCRGSTFPAAGHGRHSLSCAAQAAACGCGRNRAIRPFRSQRQLRDERL